jgi:hypothetical protein
VNARLARNAPLLPLLILLLSCGGPRLVAPDLAKIHDATAWTVMNTEPQTSHEDGRDVVRLAPIGGDGPGSNVAMALARGVELLEGTIDVDLKGGGREQRTFLGVAFGVTDAKTFEAVYFRPFNFQADDPVHRGRAVQYVAWPDHPWEELRAHAPPAYENAVDPVPDPGGWFHARVEVGRDVVRVFVDHAERPCLVVKRLASPRAGGVGGAGAVGAVGLWVDSREGSFASLTIAPAR